MRARARPAVLLAPRTDEVQQGHGGYGREVIALPGRVVVFDYGEVLSLAPSEADRATLVRSAGVPAESFWPAYWRRRNGLDHGRMSVREYWTGIGEECGTAFDDARMQVLWAADVRSWISVDPAVVQVLAELHGGGTRMALLSNAGFDFGSLFRFAPTGRFFERVFVSAEIGLLKPEPAIYLHVARELGIAPTELVFVDNREDNVRGAEAVGIRSHVFTGADTLRTFLDALAADLAADLATPESH